MSKGAYTYEPGNITEFGKDRMRFELGDTMVEGLADTTALTDEEIQAAIDAYPKKWKRAKLMLLESLCRRFAYEVNTKTGPLSLDMNGRAKLWKEDYDKLKKEVQAESVSVPRFGNGVDGPPYFHTGSVQVEPSNVFQTLQQSSTEVSNEKIKQGLDGNDPEVFAAVLTESVQKSLEKNSYGKTVTVKVSVEKDNSGKYGLSDTEMNKMEAAMFPTE